jgi:hypothetical protein
MAAPSVADLVQTFAKGITRPEADQSGWLPYASDLNFVYARATGTTSQRPVGVPAGWLYYDTTIPGFVGWDGASWVEVGGGGSDLAAPINITDDGKVAVGSAGDLTYIDQGNLLRRKTSTNHSTAALTFTTNQVLLWNGSTTVSLTANFTGAVDGAEISLLFPAGSMNTFTLSADIDPTGLIDDTFTSNLVAWLLRLKYHACGPCIEFLNFSQVTDQ